MHCEVMEKEVPQGEHREPYKYKFEEGELDFCRYQVTPDRGLLVLLARVLDPEKDVDNETKLERMSKDIGDRPVIVSFYQDKTGILQKRVEVKLTRYFVEDDPNEPKGVMERAFLQ